MAPVQIEKFSSIHFDTVFATSGTYIVQIQFLNYSG